MQYLRTQQNHQEDRTQWSSRILPPLSTNWNVRRTHGVRVAAATNGVYGYYLMVVKESQPALYAQIALLFNVPPVPVRPGELLTYSHTERSGHGRVGVGSAMCYNLSI